MAENRINFSPVEVDGIISKIKNAREDINGNVNSLQGTVNELCAGWQGKSSETYSREFAELKTSVMDKFIGMLDELSVQLKSISTAMQDADQQISDKISMK